MIRYHAASTPKSTPSCFSSELSGSCMSFQGAIPGVWGLGGAACGSSALVSTSLMDFPLFQPVITAADKGRKHKCRSKGHILHDPSAVLQREPGSAPGSGTQNTPRSGAKVNSETRVIQSGVFSGIRVCIFVCVRAWCSVMCLKKEVSFPAFFWLRNLVLYEEENTSRTPLYDTV